MVSPMSVTSAQGHQFYMSGNPFDLYDVPRSAAANDSSPPEDEVIYDYPLDLDLGDMEIYDYPPDASELGQLLQQVPHDNLIVMSFCIAAAILFDCAFACCLLQGWLLWTLLRVIHLQAAAIVTVGAPCPITSIPLVTHLIPTHQSPLWAVAATDSLLLGHSDRWKMSHG